MCCASSSSGFSGSYTVGAFIGAGAFARVCKCLHRVTGQAYAVKIIRVSSNSSRPDSSSCSYAEAMEELRVYSSLEGCPGVLQLREAFDETDKSTGNGLVYAVFDLVEGGELKHAVTLRGSLAEEDARGVMRSVFQACAGMHRRGVAHRDIKPDNILLQHKHVFDSGATLVDMGLAATFSPGEDYNMHEACGTPLYMAPEILRVACERRDAAAAGASSSGSYGPEVDMWSCGMVLFNVLSGCSPFDGQNVRDLFKQILNEKISFDDPAWHMVTPGAIDLVKRCLTRDPAARITAEEALQHPWMLQL